MFIFFSVVAYSSEYLCAPICFENIDETCSSCKVCKNCKNTSVRQYIRNIEGEIVDLLKNRIVKNPELKKIYERSKENIFSKWNIDRNQPLPDELNVPRGVI